MTKIDSVLSKVLCFLVFLLLLLGFPHEIVADPLKPDEFIFSMDSKVQKLISEQNDKGLEALIKKYLAKTELSKFVLGRYYKQLDELQFKSFVDNYSAYLAKVYVDRFFKQGSNVEVKGYKELSLDRYLVSTSINFNKKMIDVDYVLIGRAKDEEDYYLLDVIASGVRMSYGSRDEIQQVIESRSDGLKLFLEDLEKKFSESKDN